MVLENRGVRTMIDVVLVMWKWVFWMVLVFQEWTTLGSDVRGLVLDIVNFVVILVVLEIR